MDLTKMAIAICEVLICFKIAAAVNLTGKGTVPNLREIIIGRCIEYQTGLVVQNDNMDLEELGSKNCTRIWEHFRDSFAYRHPCDVSMEDYDEFLEASKTKIPKNMATYWDGWDIYTIVTNYANKGQRSVTLETTLPGYLGNGISFCGSPENDGLGYEKCAAEGDCGFGKGALEAFWSKLSTYFGSEGEGNVKVFFNSNREHGSFQEYNSFFYHFEVLYLNSTRVNHMDIFVVTELNQTRGDTCESPSLIRLGELLDERHISHSCYEQPEAVMHVLCADEPDHADCQFKVRSGGTSALWFSSSRQTTYLYCCFYFLTFFAYWRLTHFP
ncbi:ADP-ribosyl cyclase/cyclic ADP-ribose hydrolase-like [Antedon mediterranea]|uniref:ADP-ribosyl cyclase/cyclic ADP-ribose hydrolase-like n=1 Tax=Antedon mediterranea TaxID=105859 RepID=UPI003AF9F2F6